MPYPFSWQPSRIYVLTPSQVSVFASNGSPAVFSIGVAVSIEGTITFSLATAGKYTVKVRYGLELETAKFTTATSGISTAQFVTYEQINDAGIKSLSNFLTLEHFNDSSSAVRSIVNQIVAQSSNALPSDGTANQLVRRNAAGTAAEWFTINKTTVGLNNVDNTADDSKPVSAAQQTALNLKANAANPAFTGTPTGLTKAHVGLGSVDNTADSTKPVSTPQQTALNLKRNSAQAITTRTTTPYSMALIDEIVFANMATAITISLPDPTTASIGREYIIKNIGAGTTTVNSQGTSKTIDGTASQTLAQWAKARYVSNGTAWFSV
jgi:hypothetical protein